MKCVMCGNKKSPNPKDDGLNMDESGGLQLESGEWVCSSDCWSDYLLLKAMKDATGGYRKRSSK